ncbi:MAG: hypothetical protein PHR44_08150 [Candidatus Omnitrophica bacterium]|nr:hypothetical protein [Candidatus Omnitrophota bacterium]
MVNRWHRGQASLEYAVLIIIVVSAFVAMRVYVQRAVQANLKALENQINAEPLNT